MAANFQSDSISFSSSIDFKRPVMKRISWKVQTNLIQTFQLFNRFQLPDIAQLFRRNKTILPSKYSSALCWLRCMSWKKFKSNFHRHQDHIITIKLEWFGEFVSHISKAFELPSLYHHPDWVDLAFGANDGTVSFS